MRGEGEEKKCLLPPLSGADSKKDERQNTGNFPPSNITTTTTTTKVEVICLVVGKGHGRDTEKELAAQSRRAPTLGRARSALLMRCAYRHQRRGAKKGGGGQI